MRLLVLFLLITLIQAGGLWYKVDNVSKFVNDWLKKNQIDNCFFQGDSSLMCLKDNELFKVVFQKIYFL